MKIGVMTFWYTHENYGQLLQCYALQKYLTDIGHEVFLIKYDKTYELERKTFLDKIPPYRLIKKIKKTIFEKNRGVKSKRAFDKFRNEYLKFSPLLYKSVDSLMKKPPEADVYITGSDQVWNYVFIGNPAPYFLQFGNAKIKRYSYAASYGHKELPETVHTQYKQYLKRFDKISVRERSGVELCESMGATAQLLPDPTFLLPASMWATLIKDTTQLSTKKNVFIYTLGNRPLEAKDNLLSYIRKDNTSNIIHTSINNDISGDTFPNIHRWLKYVKECDFVVTNSFHGIVFSIIFNTNFLALPSQGKTTGMNERITSLLSKLGLDDRIIYDFDAENISHLLSKEIDWLKVNRIIEEWTDNAKKFLTF